MCAVWKEGEELDLVWKELLSFLFLRGHYVPGEGVCK